MDEQGQTSEGQTSTGQTSDLPFDEESALLDKIVNVGVCGIAVVAVLIVGFFVIRQQFAPATPTLPAANTTQTNPPAASTAATHEKPQESVAKTTEPPKPREKRKDTEPEKVVVPVVVDVHEHRSSPRRSSDNDGR